MITATLEVISAITKGYRPQTNWCQPLKKLSKPLQGDFGLLKSDHSHFKSFSAATKVILATNNLMSAPKKVISVTTKVNLTTKDAITVTLKIISATTKVILATNKLILVTEEVMKVTLKVISAPTKVILVTNNHISAHKK